MKNVNKTNKTNLIDTNYKAPSGRSYSKDAVITLITNNTDIDVEAELVQYTVDEPMSGDTIFVIEENSEEYSTSSEDSYDSESD